jgi:copper chaperone
MNLTIEGMHCTACVERVRKAIVKVEGARVDSIEIGAAVVSVDPKREDAVIEAVRKAGYDARKSASTEQ